jgi:hypothetical protein
MLLRKDWGLYKSPPQGKPPLLKAINMGYNTACPETLLWGFHYLTSLPADLEI